MKFLVRFECWQCKETTDLFTEISVGAESETDSLGTVSYDYYLHPDQLPEGWSRTNKCGSCS